MTPKDVDAALARVAVGGWALSELQNEIMTLVKIEVEAEREACAKVAAEKQAYYRRRVKELNGDNDFFFCALAAEAIEKAIRARSQSKGEGK